MNIIGPQVISLRFYKQNTIQKLTDKFKITKDKHSHIFIQSIYIGLVKIDNHLLESMSYSGGFVREFSYIRIMVFIF